MNKIIAVWKSVGITPLEAIEKYKEKYSEYKYETISYAGRLDPMAEGVLILLIGEENRKRKKYLDVNKEYESEIVLGISTDSYDALGLITGKNLKTVSEKEIKNSLFSFLGKQNQIYPPYSSKTVNGKPLYWWAINNRINEVEIPNHNIEIYSIELLRIEKVSVNKLTKRIFKKIEKVNGDFRQKEIIKSWDKLGKENSGKKLTKIKIKVSCSSGTYIRRIAFDLGKKLGIGAFAYSIKRVKIGDVGKYDCLDLEI